MLCVCWATGAPLHTWISLIWTWISNYIYYKMWDEITYSFSHFNDATVDVREWISDFIQHFTGHVVAYPHWD